MYEDTHGQSNQEEDDEVKESFGSSTHDGFSNLADRHSAGPHRNDESSKVMDSSDEKCSENDPEHGWHPAPDDCNGRSQHGGEPSNGGKVMSEEDVFIGGDVINAILKLMSRGNRLRIQLKNTPR